MPDSKTLLTDKEKADILAFQAHKGAIQKKQDALNTEMCNLHEEVEAWAATVLQSHGFLEPETHYISFEERKIKVKPSLKAALEEALSQRFGAKVEVIEQTETIPAKSEQH